MTVKLELEDKVYLRDGAKATFEMDSQIVTELIDEYGWSWSDVYIVKEFISGDIGVVSEDSKNRFIVYVSADSLEPVVEDKAEPEKEDTSEHLVPVWKLKEAMGFFDMDCDDYEMDKIVRLANRLK